MILGNVIKNPYGTENISITENGTTTYNVRSKKYASITTTVQSHIYGAEWTGTSDPSWTRTDESANFSDPNPYFSGMGSTPSSPFDGLMPWAGMRRVTDNAAGELVEIPKFWYKWTRDGAKMKLQIADSPVSGFYVSPAHADRGDGVGERDYAYVGRYHCSGASTGTYKSISGVPPKASMTRANFRANIHNLGSNVWQNDYALFWTIRMLYLVEFADWNSQAKIGYGCGNNSATQNTGASDTMPYHTGTMQSSRLIYGVGVQYRYIEDLYGCVWNWVDGIYFNGNNIYYIKDPSSFSDSTGGTKVGTRSAQSGYIKDWSIPSAVGFEYALYPNTADNTLDGSTYSCDTTSYGQTGVVLRVGGDYDYSQGYGLFCIGGADDRTLARPYIGSRLMVLPSSQLT